METAFASRDPEGIEGGSMSLIADDFFEFGQSGRVWTAESIRSAFDVPQGEPAVIEHSRWPDWPMASSW